MPSSCSGSDSRNRSPRLLLRSVAIGRGAVVTVIVCALLSLLPLSLIASGGGGGTGEPAGTVEGVEGVEMVTPSEEGVVLVEVPGIAASDFVARFVGDTIFVPYILLSDFLRIPNEISPDFGTIGGSIPNGKSFGISRPTRVAFSGVDSFDIDPASIRMIYGEVFVELSLYSRLVGLSTRLDLERLTLIIEPNPQLPLVQWNQSRRRLGTLQNEEEPTVRRHGRLKRSLAGSPIVDWSITNYLAADRTSGSASLRLGAELLYGALELNGSLATRDNGRISGGVTGGVWRYLLPDFAPVRQIAVGSVLIDDQPYSGLEVSNVPLVSAEGFASHPLVGYSQPGWMVEMYEGGRLIDMAQADSAGTYRFNVPMGYGTIDRTLRHVGPYGETLTERRRLQLNPAIIPAGNLHYTMRFGRENLDATSAMAGVGRVDFGISDYLSIGADARLFVASGASLSPDSVQPTGFANLWLGESISMGLRYLPRLNSAAADLYWISPDNIVLRGGVDSLSFSKGTFTGTFGAVLPVGNFSLGSYGRYRRGSGEDRLEIVPQISGYVEDVSFTASTSIAGTPAPTSTEITTDTSRAIRPLRTMLQMIATPIAGLATTLQATYDHDRSRIGSMQLSTHFPISSIMGVTIGWELPELKVRQSSLQLQLCLDLGFSRGVIASNMNERMVSSSSFLQGSLLVSPRGVKMLSDFAVGQSAILLRAFHDRNGNGRRDDGEEEIAPPAASIRMAGMQIDASDGRFYQLPPNRECEVEIDRWCHSENGIFPSMGHYAIYTGSSSQQLIDVPFVEGFDVSGNCRIDSTAGSLRISAVNGLRVQLSSEATGALYDGEIYSDGSIYIPSVGAGTYRIVFDPAQLASRRIRVVSMPESVTLTRENDRIGDLLFGRR